MILIFHFDISICICFLGTSLFKKKTGLWDKDDKDNEDKNMKKIMNVKMKLKMKMMVKVGDNVGYHVFKVIFVDLCVFKVIL